MNRYPFIFSDEPHYRLRRHLYFWGAWWLFQAFLYSFVAAEQIGDYFKRLPLSVAESFIFLTAHIFLAYFLIYLVIPRFLMRQRYWGGRGYVHPRLSDHGGHIYRSQLYRYPAATPLGLS